MSTWHSYRKFDEEHTKLGLGFVLIMILLLPVAGFMGRSYEQHALERDGKLLPSYHDEEDWDEIVEVRAYDDMVKRTVVKGLDVPRPMLAHFIKCLRSIDGDLKIHTSDDNDDTASRPDEDCLSPSQQAWLRKYPSVNQTPAPNTQP